MGEIAFFVHAFITQIVRVPVVPVGFVFHVEEVVDIQTGRYRFCVRQCKGICQAEIIDKIGVNGAIVARGVVDVLTAHVMAVQHGFESIVREGEQAVGHNVGRVGNVGSAQVGRPRFDPVPIGIVHVDIFFGKVFDFVSAEGEVSIPAQQRIESYGRRKFQSHPVAVRNFFGEHLAYFADFTGEYVLVFILHVIHIAFETERR